LLDRDEETIKVCDEIIDQYSNQDVIYYQSYNPKDKTWNTRDRDYQLSDVWFRKGNAYYQMNKYDDAVLCFDKAISLFPACLYLEHKGYALVHLSRCDEANKLFQKGGCTNDYPGWYEGKIAAEKCSVRLLPYG